MRNANKSGGSTLFWQAFHLTKNGLSGEIYNSEIFLLHFLLLSQVEALSRVLGKAREDREEERLCERKRKLPFVRDFLKGTFTKRNERNTCQICEQMLNLKSNHFLVMIQRSELLHQQKIREERVRHGERGNRF